MSQPFLRGGVWQFRRAVPDELVPIVGKLEIKHSLKTRDAAKVRALHAAALIDSERVFERARAQLAGQSVLTPDDVKQLASRWYRDESMRTDKAGDFTTWLAEDHLTNTDAFGEQVMLYTTLKLGWERDGDLWDIEAMVAPLVERALRDNGLPKPEKASPVWTWLMSEFDLRLHQLSDWALSRQEGSRTLPGDGALPHSPISTERQPSQGLGHSLVMIDGRTIRGLFDAYAESRRSNDRSRATNVSLGECKATIEDFVAIHADINVLKISRDLVAQHRVALTKLPSAKGVGMRQLSAPERMARAERDGLQRLAAATVRKRIRHLSAVLSYGVGRGWLEQNPIIASKLGREVSQAATKQQNATRKRKHYTPDELKTIFSSPAFTQKDWKPPRASFGRAWYWLPILMYYSGARIEELAQMTASEVRRSPGEIPYLSILEALEGEDGDRTVKTDSSRRAIPLHDDLIARGFLAYADSLPEGGQLFPLLRKCPDGYYSTNFAKRWGIYLRETLHLKSSARPSHGFRHTFKTLARDAGIAADVSDAITGHAGEGVGSTYGVMLLATVAREINRLPTIEKVIAVAETARPADEDSRAGTEG
jgi:integrase